MEASRNAVVTAYATDENAKLGASRFVGLVEIRGERGSVWLRGRRVPSWWLWTHTGGRVAGFLGRVMLVVAFFYWDWWPFVPSRKTDEVGDLWSAFKTRTDTVCWSAAKSRLVLNEAVAKTRISRDGAGKVQLDVPIGRKGGRARLYLEVPPDRHTALMAALYGQAPSPARV